MTAHVDDWDAVGIGIGPANLSLAALLAPLPRLRTRFCERRDRFAWHPRLLIDGAGIQVSFLKDLVTLVDPTNPFSFLAFLHDQGRLYSFLNAEFPRTRRAEFDQYYRWACERLDNLQFASPVDALSCDDERLWVHVGATRVATRNVILGTGAEVHVPAFAAPYLGPTVYHASRYLSHRAGASGQRAIVLGGGQTGAELVFDLLNLPAPPSSLVWVSRRSNFLPLDESPFTNEWFTPAYRDHFFGLESGLRRRLLKSQKLASDGISPDLLRDLYRKFYEHRYLRREGCDWRCCPGREAVGLGADSEGGWQLDMRRLDADGSESLAADVVILATGFRHRLPACLEPLAGRLDLTDGEPLLNQDFSVSWDGPPGCRLFVQGTDGSHHGIADRNLSLNAWRSAVIVNRIAGEEVYPVRPPEPFLHWDGPATGSQEVRLRVAANHPGDEP